ncbi:MAG: Mov34/MPN/PAD-1 family protein [Caulobacter sp.]|nr:Mov34/MPN/PAD-1 family protein [Caulobacter sp.]
MIWNKATSLLVENSALDKIERAAGDSLFTVEAGGILLGSYKRRCIHVVDATTPQKCDSASRYSFSRDAAGHREIAQHAWQQSSGTTTYVGEWHSHPEQLPTPSTIDLDDWRRVMREQKRPMAFIIQGEAGRYLEIRHPLFAKLTLTPVQYDECGILFKYQP